MDFKDVKAGMRAVPHDKTVYGTGLNDSNVWNYQGGLEQGFLYVIKTLDNFFMLDVKKDSNAGDFFNACDFEPYIESSSKQKFGGFIQGNKTVVYFNGNKGEANYNPNDVKYGMPFNAPYGLLLAYCRATNTPTNIVDMLFKKPEEVKKTVAEPVKEKFVPHLVRNVGSHRSLGEIGKPTGVNDITNQPLFIGDTVELCDSDGERRFEAPIVFECDNFEKMGAYGELGRSSSSWKFLKKRSYKDVGNGEMVAGVKYIKEESK